MKLGLMFIVLIHRPKIYQETGNMLLLTQEVFGADSLPLVSSFSGIKME
jgi:hypothetical protein